MLIITNVIIFVLIFILIKHCTEQFSSEQIAHYRNVCGGEKKATMFKLYTHIELF